MISSFASADGSDTICNVDGSQNQELTELIQLATTADQLTSFMAKQVALEHTHKLCKKARKNGESSIRFRGDKLKFFIFSHTYRTEDKYYFCKNKKGHEAYVAQIQKLLLGIFESKMKKIERQQARERRRARKPNPLPKSQKTKSEKWVCIIPTYYYKDVIVDSDIKENLTMTYGEICTPYQAP